MSSTHVIRSTCSALDIPYISFEDEEDDEDDHGSLGFSVSVRPRASHLRAAVADLAAYAGWTRAAVVFAADDRAAARRAIRLQDHLLASGVHSLARPLAYKQVRRYDRGVLEATVA